MLQVFIISEHLMFGHGLESLLSKEEDIEIIGHETDIDKAVSAVSEAKPDVVLLDNTISMNGSVPQVISLLRQNPNMQIMGLNLHNNHLYLYQVQERIIKKTSDLLEAMQLSNHQSFQTDPVVDSQL